MPDTISSGGSELQASLRPWPYLICIGLLGYYLFLNVGSYRRLRHIPGPKLGALSNLWWIRAAISGKGHLALADACTQYGKAKVARFSVDVA
jgi:hypothetical protein